MKRAIVIVLDGCGAGAAPDQREFDPPGEEPDTLANVWRACGGLDCPNLVAAGFFAGSGVGPAPSSAAAEWGRLVPLSKGGKDSVTGHWEMMGVALARPFPTYPTGFPPDVVQRFVSAIGVDVLGNVAASGTEIIARLGSEHVATGRPILYTSADSVFQIAAHEGVVPLEQLYAMCESARDLLVAPHDVQRVIARPFVGDATSGFVRTGGRRDYPLAPPPNVVDAIGDVEGIGVVPELFGGRGFRDRPRTQSNAEHAVRLFEALGGDARFIFANFEDFDMKFGHRNDVEGFGACLEEFDRTFGRMLGEIGAGDLLMLTADHGNDPTTPSTDHNRECVPVVAIAAGQQARALGDVAGFAWIGRRVCDHLGVGFPQ